ncbi:hypothetical protein MLD38_020552 [Melastoma candidum]|uniref:Uncharacterized protein n=1 Tax=Melastoma candidum TaxID=119954 RepID=A0ACB9QLD4_9MYRT|nr:hypothetical protein MLD38_020552 [Melastoma candidum]
MNSSHAFNFDLGNSNKPRSLNDQKTKPLVSPSPYSSSPQQPAARNPGWQPGRPSWTHQPSPASAASSSLSGPTSMVGDIFGKSWSSTSAGSGAGIGIAPKDPNLFGDLLGSAMGQGKSKGIGGGGGISGGSGNVPLKNAGGMANKSPYSMGNLSDSLPKTGISGGSTGVSGIRGSSNGIGGYSSNSYGSTGGIGVRGVSCGNASNNVNLGGTGMKNMAGRGGSGIGGGMSAIKDPFGDLSGFGLKDKPVNLNSTGKGSVQGGGGFGDFQNATKPIPSNVSSSFDAKFDDFGTAAKDFESQNQTPSQEPEASDFDSLFPSSGVSGGQQQAEMDDWGFDSGLGAGNDGGFSTTELEGLPPPPAGVSASAAKGKGMDNYKQGQYADAIKWLSWAVVLLEKSGDTSVMEVLSCRASCYKEVGEYKKAVADCSKVLDQDGKNVTVLVQRALLYESMEKYRLGAEDLRTVLRIDPGNRVARSTVHRLEKMAD